jgi:PAS domain S-box-containing protein
MKLLALGISADLSALTPPWIVCTAETIEQANEMMATDHRIRVVLCFARQGLLLPHGTNWIQLGGSASEAYANKARGWVGEPLVVDELRMALRSFEDLLNLRSVLHEVDDSFVLVDTEWRYLYVNEAAHSLTGKERPYLLGRTLWEVFPEVKGTDMEVKLKEAMTGRRPIHFRRFSEFRNRMFQHHLYPVPQGLAVITSDVTELHDAAAAARESEQQLRLLTEILPQMVWTTDETGDINYLNPHWTEYTGLPREGMSQTQRRALLHPDDRERVNALLEQATQEKQGYELEARLKGKDGIYRWHLSRGRPVTTEDSVYWVGASTDIDDLKRAQHALSFLARASQLLSSSLDYRETLSRMIDLAVPELSDWMTVDLVENGELKQLAVAHSEPSKVNLAIELNNRYPRRPDDEFGAYSVLRTGESELGPPITDEMLQQVARDREHLDLLRGLGLCSYLCVPLKARGRMFGVLTLVSAENRRFFTPRDLALAEDLANRAALAIDNSLLYEKSQEELARRTKQEESLRVAQTELERARDEAVRANRMKSAFLANMSHEIRTPMNGIRGMVEFLEESDLPTQHADYVETIRECADSLLSILNDVLDLSRIEAGKLEIRNTVFDLPTVVKHAFAIYKHLASEKGLEYETVLNGLPEFVTGDPDRLRQILVNLLSNAVKFTDSGSVKLRVSYSPLVIEVQDTGPGISPEVQQKLFQPFSQGDESLTRRFQGAGLGLSIVYRLAKLMNGKIELESSPGVGSNFRITLPLTASEKKPKETKPAETTLPLTPELRILIVEDNPINRRVLSLQLRKLKCQVTTVDDGEQAISYLRDSDTLPDIILMDCQMPRLDGYQATRRIRTMQLTEQPIIVALTAHAMVGEKEKCLAAGMDDFLAKPISLSELTAVLRRLTERL